LPELRRGERDFRCIGLFRIGGDIALGKKRRGAQQSNASDVIVFLMVMHSPFAAYGCG